MRKLMCAAATMALSLPFFVAAQTPRPSPEFKMQLPAGGEVTLSQQRGKVVALVFVLTYCGHCQETTQVLNKLQAEYGKKGLQVMMAAIDDDAAQAVPGFIRRFQPKFPVGHSTRDEALRYLQRSAIMRLTMPQLAFIDRAGTIRTQFGGDDAFFADQEKSFRTHIEALLKEDGTSAKKTSAQR